MADNNQGSFDRGDGLVIGHVTDQPSSIYMCMRPELPQAPAISVILTETGRPDMLFYIVGSMDESGLRVMGAGMIDGQRNLENADRVAVKVAEAVAERIIVDLMRSTIEKADGDDGEVQDFELN